MIFERFSRVRRGDLVFRGSGLPRPLGQLIGRVWVRPRPRFRFSFSYRLWRALAPLVRFSLALALLMFLPWLLALLVRFLFQ